MKPLYFEAYLIRIPVYLEFINYFQLVCEISQLNISNSIKMKAVNKHFEIDFVCDASNSKKFIVDINGNA